MAMVVVNRGKNASVGVRDEQEDARNRKKIEEGCDRAPRRRKYHRRPAAAHNKNS